MKVNAFKPKKYSMIEAYHIAYLAFLSIHKLNQARKLGLMDKKFTERIMLAVTHVNQCEACSYAHTKMALELNMSFAEIQDLLAGTNHQVPEDELAAILFAQHVADTRNHPTQEAWIQLVALYGEEKAYGILAAARMMMLGNAYGLPLSSFMNRFKGKPRANNSIIYEISMLLSSVIAIPIAIVVGLIAKSLHVKIIRFS